tara:strand:+ start:71 stop:265 length:195 start_codon:yes stop_codon:yes gene_type:complete
MVTKRIHLVALAWDLVEQLAHEMWEHDQGYTEKGPHCLLPKPPDTPPMSFWLIYDKAVRCKLNL